MPRPCSICQHPSRASIDQALVAGESAPRIAAKYRDTSSDSLLRHKADHLPAKMAKAQEAAEVAQADDLLTQLRGLRSKAVQILLRAEREGDLRTALAGIREARGCLEVLAEMEGELDRRAVVNVTLTSEFQAVQAAILGALGPWPEARVVVASRLLALEGVPGGHRN